jgi:hypothetical protein
MFVSHWLSLRQLRTHKQVHSHTASLKWHRHSCLCSDEHQRSTSNHHPRPHFTFASAQPDPRFQSNFRGLPSPNFNLGQRDEVRLKWHRHSCLCSDEHQPSTSNHHPRPHFTSASTPPELRLQWNFRELRSLSFNLLQRNKLRLRWNRRSCLCSAEHQLPTSTANIGLPEANEAKIANHSQNYCVECRSR